MGLGGSCRGGVGWGRVAWVMEGWGGVGHEGERWVMNVPRVGWGESCRAGVGHAGVGWGRVG